MNAKEFYEEYKGNKEFTLLTSTGINTNYEAIFQFAEALAEVNKSAIAVVSRRCLLESILEDMKSTHCEYHQEIVEGYLHNDC